MKQSAQDDRRRKASTLKWLALVVSGAAVALSGCALSKSPQHAKVVTEALPPGTTIPPAWTASSEASGPVTNDWLKSFNDPHLDAVVAQAIAKNLDLRQAADQVEIARQKVVVVGSQLKPHISATLGVNTLRDKDEPSNFNSNAEALGVAWEPDVWGRLRAQRAAAQAGYQATALDYSYARQSLAATTSTSWYQAVATRQLVAVDEQALQTYEGLLRLAKVKLAAGQVTQLDVAEASANVNEARNQLRYLQGLLSEEQRNLEVLIGSYPAAAVEVSREFVPLPPPVQADLPSTLLERRPDLVSAERQVLVAFRALEASRLALLPSFSLTADGGHLYHEVLSILHLNPWYYQVGIGMNVPIYAGGALQAQVKIATAEQQQAVAHYGSVALNAFREVETALTNENLYAQRLQDMEQAVQERTESVRLATIKYKAGAYDLLPVLQLQTAQLATESEVIKLRNARLTNRINLHLALGGSFDATPAVALLK